MLTIQYFLKKSRLYDMHKYHYLHPPPLSINNGVWVDENSYSSGIKTHMINHRRKSPEIHRIEKNHKHCHGKRLRSGCFYVSAGRGVVAVKDNSNDDALEQSLNNATVTYNHIRVSIFK